MKFTALKTRRAETLMHELDVMQKQITQRAYDLFRQRGAFLGAALDDWLAAERQVAWTPPIEVCQKDGEFTVEAAVAGVEPGDLDIQVTPETLLIKADVTHTHPDSKGVVHVCEFQSGHLFRLVKLPGQIDPDTVKAEYRNGLLRITAGAATGRKAKKVTVQAV